MWYPEDTCPRPAVSPEGLAGGAISAIVLVPLLSILCVLLACYYHRKRRSIKHIPTEGPVELQADYEAEVYMEPPITATAIPDGPDAPVLGTPA